MSKVPQSTAMRKEHLLTKNDSNSGPQLAKLNDSNFVLPKTLLLVAASGFIPSEGCER